MSEKSRGTSQSGKQNTKVTKTVDSKKSGEAARRYFEPAATQAPPPPPPRKKDS